MALPSKKFMDEFMMLIDKNVRVTMSNGAKFEGKLIAYNPSDYSIWLSDVRNDKGEFSSKIFIHGNSIWTIEVLEAGLDLQKLADRLSKVFPNMVKYYKEANVIVVMDRIRVTKDGVVEGTGPAAERVQKIYEEFIKEESR